MLQNFPGKERLGDQSLTVKIKTRCSHQILAACESKRTKACEKTMIKPRSGQLVKALRNGKLGEKW